MAALCTAMQRTIQIIALYFHLYAIYTHWETVQKHSYEVFVKLVNLCSASFVFSLIKNSLSDCLYNVLLINIGGSLTGGIFVAANTTTREITRVVLGVDRCGCVALTCVSRCVG